MTTPTFREEVKEFMEYALEQAREGVLSLRDISRVAWQQIQDNYEKDWEASRNDR